MEKELKIELGEEQNEELAKYGEYVGFYELNGEEIKVIITKIH